MSFCVKRQDDFKNFGKNTKIKKMSGFKKQLRSMIDCNDAKNKYE